MDWDTDDVRDDSIEAVIEWYWKYKNVIKKNMPIKTLGVTFFPDWTDRVEVMIERWKKSELSLFLARSYIYYPLRNIRLHIVNSSTSDSR